MAVTLVLLVIVAVVVALFAAWAFNTAQRLNRLHIRLDRSRDALQATLDRRCAVVAALYPELRHLASETEQVRLGATDLRSRLAQEEVLTAALRERVGAAGLPTALQDANTRVELALRFYDDAVEDTRALRLRPMVRAFRLSGTAPLPQYARGDRS